MKFMLRITVAAVVAAALLPSGTRAEAAESSTVFELAKPRKIPEHAPGSSDVLMRSLRLRPVNAKDPHDTFRALDDFHVTRLVWAYINDPKAIAKVKASGRVFGGAASSPSILKPKGDKGWYDRLVVRNLDGEPIIAPWKRKWNRSLWPCVNKPETEQRYMDYLKQYIDAGAQVMQRDEPGANFLSTRWGGCLCDDCAKKFRQWLGENADRDVLAKLGVKDLEGFDYRDYLRARGAPVGDKFGRYKGDALKDYFVAFQEDASREFHERTRAAINEYAGRRVPFSCNNGARRWGEIELTFDWTFGELSYGHATPSHLYELMRTAREHDRVQVVTMPKTGDWQTTDDMEQRTRQATAMAYACGGMCMVPWDVYMPADTPRYFGTPGQYAGLFAFIRAEADLLDGYEEAFATGYQIPASPEDEPLPVWIDDAEKVCAVVRARPGRANGPAVIHLVDWSREPKPFTLRFDPRRFFGNRPVRLALHTPADYDADTHAKARSGKDYSALKRVTPLEGGYVVETAIPALNPWGIVTVLPDSDAAAGVWPPLVYADSSTFVDKTEARIVSASKNATVRVTMDGSTPDASSKVCEGTLAIDRGGVLKARAFDKAGNASAVTEVVFERLEGRAPDRPESPRPYMRYSYYEGETAECTESRECPHCWHELPDFGAMEPVKTALTGLFGIGHRERDGHFGFVFDGFLKIDRPGLYTFYVRSDDGIRLTIGDKVVVLYDGLHGPEEREGSIPLQAGFHRFHAEYFEAFGGQSLDVLYEGPGVAKQRVPKDILFHEE